VVSASADGAGAPDLFAIIPMPAISITVGPPTSTGCSKRTTPSKATKAAIAMSAAALKNATSTSTRL